MISRRPIPKRLVLSDETYGAIRSMLLSHEIAPGARISIDGIARDLEVSQTPVREALARLESEELVSKEPLKGYAATKLLNIAELNDLFQFRAVIEPWAAKSASQKRNQTDIDALTEELNQGRLAQGLGIEEAYSAMSEHDARFHELISSMSGSQFIRDAFVRTHCHLHLFRLYQVLKSFMSDNRAEAELVSEIFKLYYQPSGEFLAFKEHEGIAGAIIVGDADKAELLMRAHIESSKDRFAPVLSALKHGKSSL